MPETIQAVTFDVGGTLIDPHPSVGHVYAEIAASFGGPTLDPHLLNHRFRAAWKAFPRQLHSAGDWAELVDQVFDDLVHPAPSRSFFPRLYERFADPDAWKIHADVLPTLEALRRDGIRIAVLSNWDDRLRPLLQRLELARFFDPIIVSCEVGAAKPDPAIFRFAASALELPPGLILHVGDDPILDLAAGHAGLQAVLIDRCHPNCSLPRIHSLTRIPEGIRDLVFQRQRVER
ncbi:MAG: HAD-IA family hydrolase [Verrucomicrobia bacterium]|nr:HAD-IA family hydrolase [Verrucomicrobiota bacterium]